MSAGQKSRLAKNLRWRISAWARHSGVSAIALLCVGVAAAQATGIAPTLSATSWSSTLRRADAGSRSPHSSLRLRGGGYSLGLRDSIMIAHSFKGEEFGPAQGMHGATYTVDVEFHVKELEPRLNWVLDIGEGMSVLKKVLAEYNLKNLDELFPSENTTTEFMCKKIYDGLADQLQGKVTGEVTVKLWESHNAWASYHGGLGKACDIC